MHRPFRFLHASDLHLEQPPRGLAEVPEYLRGALVDAPYRAAERVFDAALKERVDFLILAGDVIDPLAAGPRGLVFLTEHFQRLAQNNIAVYWAGGRADDFERWRDFGPLGETVHRFPPARVERVVHTRDGAPLAHILGTSNQQRKRLRAGEFHGGDSDLFTLAAVYATVDPETLAGHGMQYWALGGEHSRRTLATAGATIHYPGTPQGRRPQESGPRGCSLVSVDEAQRVRVTFIATDAVRYQTERVALIDGATPPQLQQTIDERAAELLADPFGPDLLVQWFLTGSPTLAHQLRNGTLAGEIANRLRLELGAKRPALWTLSIEAEPSPIPDELVEEETILGELLRSVRHYSEQPDDPLNVDALLAERHVLGNLGSGMSLDEPAVRQKVLAEVARLAVELLGPQRARS